MFSFARFLDMSILDNLWRGTLCSCGFFCLLHTSGVFVRRIRSSGETWGCLLWNLLMSIYPDIIGGLSIVYDFSYPFGRYCLSLFLWDHIGPVFPFWYNGSFGRTDKLLQAASLGFAFLLPGIIVFLWRNVLWVDFFFLSRSLFFIAAFPLIL